MREEIENFWNSFAANIQAKGGLQISLDFSKIKNKFGCHGNVQGGSSFHLIVADAFIILYTEKDNPQLVAAIAKLYGYEPFCRYTDKGRVVYEWNNGTGGSNPEKEFKLFQKHQIENLCWLLAP